MLGFACNSTIDFESEVDSIKTLLNDETHYAAMGDSEKWRSCWVSTDDATVLYMSADTFVVFTNIPEFSEALADIEPFELNLVRGNYEFVIGEERAFVRFDQRDNWAGVDNRTTQEYRILRKEGDRWKIQHSEVLELSSFDPDETGILN